MCRNVPATLDIFPYCGCQSYHWPARKLLGSTRSDSKSDLDSPAAIRFSDLSAYGRTDVHTTRLDVRVLVPGN